MPAKAMAAAAAPPDARYARSDLAEVIETSLAGHDYSHLAEWIRPPGCPCHELAPGSDATYCDLARQSCQGYMADVAMPPGEGLTVSELIGALPQPDAAGLVDAREVGTALASLAQSRLANHPYRLGLLGKRLTGALDEYEGTVPATPAGEESWSWRRCQWCGAEIPAARGMQARYCRNSHRVSSHRAKNRAEQKAAAAAAAGNE